MDHSAVTWNVPEVLGAWYFTVSAGEASAPSIVPSGQGPTGGVVPDQLHWEPLAPFTASSAMNQTTDGMPGLPLTVACNVTWPLGGIVTDIGETVTVTLLRLDPLAPPPQPAITLNQMTAPTHRALYQSITDLPLTPVAIQGGKEYHETPVAFRVGATKRRRHGTREHGSYEAEQEFFTKKWPRSPCSRLLFPQRPRRLQRGRSPRG